MPYDLSGFVFLTVFKSESLAQDARRDGWKPAIEAFYERRAPQDSASGLTPAAAVGRMGGGFVLNALGADEIRGSAISTDSDCKFVLPRFGSGGSSAAGSQSRSARNTLLGTGIRESAYFTPSVFVLLLLIILAWWRVASSGGGGRSPACTDDTPLRSTATGADDKIGSPRSSGRKDRINRQGVARRGILSTRLEKMTVKELRAQLKSRGQKTSGRKVDLIRRLSSGVS